MTLQQAEKRLEELQKWNQECEETYNFYLEENMKLHMNPAATQEEIDIDDYICNQYYYNDLMNSRRELGSFEIYIDNLTEGK